MKQRIFHSAFQLVLRTLLGILKGAVAICRALVFFIQRLGHSGLVLLQALTPLFLFFYLTGRQMRIRISAGLAPIKGRILYILGHRYFVHALIILIVFFVSAPTIFAYDTPKGVFGEQTLLRTLAPDNDEEQIVIDDTLPAHEVNAIIEGIFQDTPPTRPIEDASMPLALDGDTLQQQEVPGTNIPMTRIEIVEYEVKSGDTPWSIAEQFGVSIPTVLWENKLNLYSKIRPGQKLTILPASGVSHMVKKGETLAAIAKRYRASLDEIQEYNKIALSNIAPGVRLIIPGGQPYVPPAPVAPRRREVVGAPPPSSLVSLPGKLLWPVPLSKRITQYFKWSHAGIDIGDKRGDPIVASESGVVEFAAWGRGGWGNTVVVDHGNGMKTRYSHASKILVGVGQEVAKGQTLALIGSTGRSTGPHLDYRIYVNGRNVNPLQYLR